MLKMLSTFTISIAIPASSNFFLTALALSMDAESRHLRSSSVAVFRAASCSGVRGLALRPPGAGPAAVTTLSGSPMSASTGWVRNSTPLTPSWTHFWMISSIGALRPPKL
jgi:hypothetical protein